MLKKNSEYIIMLYSTQIILMTKQRDQYCTMGICHEHELPSYHLDNIRRDKNGLSICRKSLLGTTNCSPRIAGLLLYIYVSQQTICTFPTLILKLYVLLELFLFKADKRVLFHAKFNIYAFHNLFNISKFSISYNIILCIFIRFKYLQCVRKLFSVRCPFHALTRMDIMSSNIREITRIKRYQYFLI